MSDSGHRRRFEAWLAAELRRAVVTDVAGPQRVMSLVRASSGHASRRRRGSTPATAFAFTVCVLGVFAFRMATLLMPATSTANFAERGAGLRDTISAFTDSMEGTARLVGVAVIAPAAARIAVVHDFHGWDLHISKIAQRDERVAHGGDIEHRARPSAGARDEPSDTISRRQRTEQLDLGQRAGTPMITIPRSHTPGIDCSLCVRSDRARSRILESRGRGEQPSLPFCSSPPTPCSFRSHIRYAGNSPR